jgi:hypothetical protein
VGYGRFFGLDRRVWLALPETLCRIRNWTVSIVRQMRIIIGKVGLGFFAFFAGLETRAPRGFAAYEISGLWGGLSRPGSTGCGKRPGFGRNSAKAYLRG